MKDTDAKPQWLTEKALKCAIAACQDSEWSSDRQFAKACGDELEKRYPEAHAPINANGREG